MKSVFTRASRRSPRFSRVAAGCAPVIAFSVVIATQSGASAAQAPVNLGTAASFAVLAGTTVTNTGPSTINGDLGVSPGTAVTGFPPGTLNGAQHDADAVALNAQSDLTTAYNDAAGRTPAASVPADLSGESLTPGVYKNASSIGLTGTVTLNGEGDPNAVFIFQAGSTLITGSASHVALTGGARACNVFWQVGSSATLGTNSTFVGNILALQSISVTTGATIAGRALARNGQVSLDDNTITSANCATPTSILSGVSPILSGVSPVLSGAVSPILSGVTQVLSGVIPALPTVPKATPTPTPTGTGTGTGTPAARATCHCHLPPPPPICHCHEWEPASQQVSGNLAVTG